MNSWDKVTITWKFGSLGLPTSLCMDGSFDVNAIDPRVFDSNAQERVHGIFEMEAVSQPRSHEEDQRRGEMILKIGRLRGPTVPPNSKVIVEFLGARLNNAEKKLRPMENRIRIEPPARESWMETTFKLYFILANREQFCDTALEVARAVFEALGVHDDGGHWLARFSTKRDSFVTIDGSWITFDRYLRMTHRLPIWGPEDER